MQSRLHDLFVLTPGLSLHSNTGVKISERLRRKLVKFQTDVLLEFAGPKLRRVLFYFFASPSASTSDNRDMRRYAGLSTDHITSGMSSHEIAIAIRPFLV